MFNILLNAFLTQTKRKDFTLFKKLVIFVALLLCGATLGVLIWPDTLLWILFVSLLVLFTVCAFLDNRSDMSRWSKEYSAYDDNLNLLKKILEELLLGSNGNTISWYSKERIQYLIAMGESKLAYESDDLKKANNFLHMWVLPIIAYISLVLKDTLDNNSLIVLASVCLFILLLYYALNYILKLMADILFENGSKNATKRLVIMLKDLLIRDFSNSSPSENSDDLQ